MLGYSFGNKRIGYMFNNNKIAYLWNYIRDCCTRYHDNTPRTALSGCSTKLLMDSRQHLSNYKTEITFFVKSKKCIFSTPSNIVVWNSAKHQHITDKGLTF